MPAMVDSEGHVGLRHEILCTQPTPVTWMMDAGGITWVVAHSRFDPEHGIAEGVVTSLGLVVVDKCPLVGDPYGWCCCHAVRRDHRPSPDEAATLAAEYSHGLRDMERQWGRLLEGIGGVLQAAYRITGKPGLLHIGAGERERKPIWHETYQPHRL